MTALRALVLVLVLIGVSSAHAVQPDEILSDPALEARARALSRELRCMVCQNQSIDDSDAPLARDLRILVRERLVAGDSDTKVIDFLTALLWLAPLIALVAGGCGLAFELRRRRDAPESATAQETALTPAEQARVADLLRRSEK